MMIPMIVIVIKIIFFNSLFTDRSRTGTNHH